MNRRWVAWWLLWKVSNYQNMPFSHHKKYILVCWSCIQGNTQKCLTCHYKFRKNFIILLIIVSIIAILSLSFDSPTPSLQSVSMSAFWLYPPHPIQSFSSVWILAQTCTPPAQTRWRNTWTLPMTLDIQFKNLWNNSKHF